MTFFHSFVKIAYPTISILISLVSGTNSLIIANSDNVQRNNFSSVRSNNSSSSSSRSCNMKLCTDDIHNHIISNDNNDKVQDNPFIQKENQGNDCSSVSNSSKLSSKHFQFSPERDNISNIIIDNKDDGNEKKIVLDRVEDDVFKNKRAAHYNEFKLGEISLFLSIFFIFFQKYPGLLISSSFIQFRHLIILSQFDQLPPSLYLSLYLTMFSTLSLSFSLSLSLSLFLSLSLLSVSLSESFMITDTLTHFRSSLLTFLLIH